MLFVGVVEGHVSGKVAAFAAYGLALKNNRWSWSAADEERKLVVLQLWIDKFNYKIKPVQYSDFGNPNIEDDKARLGNKERMKNLVYARDFCGGRFNVVIGVAVDVKANPRETKEAYAQKAIIMEIAELDESTGELKAKMVNGS